MLYNFLFRLLSLVSLLLERTLSQLHSAVYQAADFAQLASSSVQAEISATTSSFMRERPYHQQKQHQQQQYHQQQKQKQRAWWDVRKGSAIVLWSSPMCMSGADGSGDLTTWDLVHRLALALASIEKRSEGAGRAPYTVIVVVPSAQHGLAPLIQDWAKTKADIAMAQKRNSTSPSYRRKSWLTRFFSEPEDASPERRVSEEHLHAVTSTEAQMDEKARPRRNSGASSSRASSSSGGSSNGGNGSTTQNTTSKQSQKKRRRPSNGTRWTASDVVGLGMDMLKGLRIGQDLFDDAIIGSKGDARLAQRTVSRIGAVIPVVADTSTPAGLSHATSTIHAYCNSHDLLLRGLVVVPFVMGTRVVSTPAVGATSESPSANISPSTSSAPTPRLGASSWSSVLASTHSSSTSRWQTQMTKAATSSLSKASVRRMKQALDSDIIETLDMISALLPALITDGGRVIGMVPTRWNALQSEPMSKIFHGEQAAFMDEDDEDQIAEIAHRVARDALVTMWQCVSTDLNAIGIEVCQVHMAPIRRRQSQTSEEVRTFKRDEGWVTFLARRAVSRLAETCFALLHPTLIEDEASFDSTLLKQGHKTSDEEDQFVYGGARKIHKEQVTFSGLFSTQPIDASKCPPLLIDALRSSLVRSHPRSKYCVGLGPRIQETIMYLCPPVVRNLASQAFPQYLLS